jgi:hypothetical protein
MIKGKTEVWKAGHFSWHDAEGKALRIEPATLLALTVSSANGPL